MAPCLTPCCMMKLSLKSPIHLTFDDNPEYKSLTIVHREGWIPVSYKY